MNDNKLTAIQWICLTVIILGFSACTAVTYYAPSCS
jgi:hypothetical protein